MSEMMLRDAGTAHDLRYVILRYFNVAGADPALRTGLASLNATHLLKVAVETAVGRRPQIDVYGTHYPTPDGTCIRDYIHVSDLARAHSAALDYLRRIAPAKPSIAATATATPCSRSSRRSNAFAGAASRCGSPTRGPAIR